MLQLTTLKFLKDLQKNNNNHGLNRTGKDMKTQKQICKM
jgi:hypothetical protein